MCSMCGEGFRVEATVMGGPNAGQVKAVLHPISASWENLYSIPSNGSVLVATQDPAAADIWPGVTGIYISQVLPDGSRKAHFGGYIEDYDGSGGGATTIAPKSLDTFLWEGRLIAGKNDPWGLTVIGGLVTVVKPTSPTTVSTVYTTNITPTLSGYAAFLVNMARGDLIPDSSPGLLNLSARVENGGTTFFDQAVNWWDFKNVGQAIQELVEAENGTKYRLEHTFENGVWSSEMIFNETAYSGVDRDYTIRSDFEAIEYGLKVSAEDKATRVYGLGSGTEGNTQFSVAFDSDTANNLPEYQVSTAWKDQTLPDKIDSLTRGYVSDHRDPITVPSATIVGLPDYDPNAPGFDPQKGFPGPDILKPGDTFKTSIGYGVITVRDLGVRCLGVSWSLNEGAPAERVIGMQPLIRANSSVRTQTPAKPPALTQPVDDTQNGGNPVTATPWPVPGLVKKITVGGLTEISGMEVSVAKPGTVLVFNDEVNEYQVRYVSLNTGGLYSSVKFSTGLPSLGDPECIRYSRVSKKMVLGDTGDNDNVRPTSGANQPALYAFTEPTGTGNHTVNVDKYPIRYPSGEKVNCETLLIHPETDEVFLISKEDDRARVFSFGKFTDLGTGSGDNVGVLVRTLTSVKLASDGTHTFNGDNVLLRSASVAKTLAFAVNDTLTNWKLVDQLATPAMPQSEAIAVESTCAFLTTTETKKSGGGQPPVYRVLLTKALGAECGTTGGASGSGTGTPANPAKTVPGQVLNLSAFKVTLPVGSGGKPKEVGPTAISSYELKPWFYTDNGVDVVFRANVDGYTTSNSGYPRSELRQLKSNGDLAAWSNKNETWTMECQLAFTHLPGGKPHVVGMQIHGDDNTDDLTVLRLEGSNLYVTKQDDTHYELIQSGYSLGTWITVKVVAKKGGGIDWYLNGVKKATIGGVWSGLYFKTGAYVQANESNGTGYGEVKLRSVQITRST